MTIRWQIFIFVALLFVAVGAMGSGVARWLETEAVRQTFDDEANGLAVTVTEFIAPADITALEAGRPLAKTQLGAALDRLGRWAIVRRLFVLDRRSGRALADTAPAGTPLPPPAAVQGMGLQEVRPLPLRQGDGGHFLLPLVVYTKDGKAILGVEMSADQYLQERATILRDVVADGILATLAGLLVAGLLGWLISRPIHRLGRAVDKIGTATFVADETGSVIQEVSDLGNTFGVMHSVLGETVEKGRRALLESDTYRSDRGLAAVYRQELQPPAGWSGGGADPAWLPVGSAPPAGLAGAIALADGGGAAFAGVAGLGGDLAATVRARAAAAYLATSVAHRPLAAAAAETETLFGLTELRVVRWDGGHLETWSSGRSQGAGPDSAAWAAGGPVSLACLGPINRNRLDFYLANFAGHATESLLAELPPLLDAAESGLVLVLRRRATT